MFVFRILFLNKFFFFWNLCAQYNDRIIYIISSRKALASILNGDFLHMLLLHIFCTPKSRSKLPIRVFYKSKSQTQALHFKKNKRQEYFPHVKKPGKCFLYEFRPIGKTKGRIISLGYLFQNLA